MGVVLRLPLSAVVEERELLGLSLLLWLFLLVVGKVDGTEELALYTHPVSVGSDFDQQFGRGQRVEVASLLHLTDEDRESSLGVGSTLDFADSQPVVHDRRTDTEFDNRSTKIKLLRKSFIFCCYL